MQHSFSICKVTINWNHRDKQFTAQLSLASILRYFWTITNMRSRHLGMRKYLSAWDKIVMNVEMPFFNLPAYEIRKNGSVWNTLCEDAGMYEKCKVNSRLGQCILLRKIIQKSKEKETFPDLVPVFSVSCEMIMIILIYTLPYLFKLMWTQTMVFFIIYYVQLGITDTKG